jgi:Predicted ATPase (AAA+ superfamily)
MKAPELERLSAETPWPGMRPYSEDDAPFFFGREAEVADLLVRIERARLTLLYAQAGLGKTSLIRAGLIPELSKRGYLPIYLRPRALLEGREEPISKIINEIKIAVKDRGIETIGNFETRSLWELLHRDSFALWDASKRNIVIPVLIFDQFEELFQVLEEPGTITQHARVLLDNLADLVENRLPTHLRGVALDDLHFDLKSTDYRVVFSFREDYLPHIRQLRRILPSVIENHLRLEPLTGNQAFEIILQAGKKLIERDAASRLVRDVGKRSGVLEALSSKGEEAFRGANNGRGELIVEPALLSVMCFYQNAARIQTKTEKISAALIQQTRIQDIFVEYYRWALSDVDSKTRRFVESKLVTADGRRVPYPVSELGEAVTSASINKLISRGVLRRESFEGEERLELSHDLLITPIQGARQRRKHRRNVWLACGLLLAFVLGLGWSWYNQRQKAQQNFIAKTDLLAGVLSFAFVDETQSNRMAKLTRPLKNAKTPSEVDSLGQAILDEVKLYEAKLATLQQADLQRARSRARSLMMFTIQALQAKIDLVGEGGGKLKVMRRLQDETQNLCKAQYVVPIDEIVTWFRRHGVEELPCQ